MRNIRRWARLLILCLTIGFLSAAAQQGYAWLTDKATSSPLQVEAASYTTGDVIVLDAGHGGYDTGSISDDGVYEKDITLAITQKIGEQLEKAGYTVVYTRTSDEVSWSNDNRDDLRTRVAIGEEAGADYYISIHTNASEYGDGASGFEAYIDYENDTITAMAQSIAQQLMQLGYTQNRGLKSTQDSSLYVIDSNPVPSMLQGLGFEKEALDSVCISFDKLDKIGPAGVAAELREKGFAQTAVAALEAFLAKGAFGLDEVAALCEDKALSQNVRYVLQTTRAAAKGAYVGEYNPSL